MEKLPSGVWGELMSNLPTRIPGEVPWSKLCHCCKGVHTGAGWKRLKLVGYQPDPEHPTLELRNCHCGSTISVPVDFEEDVP